MCFENWVKMFAGFWDYIVNSGVTQSVILNLYCWSMKNELFKLKSHSEKREVKLERYDIMVSYNLRIIIWNKLLLCYQVEVLKLAIYKRDKVKTAII